VSSVCKSSPATLKSSARPSTWSEMKSSHCWHLTDSLGESTKECQPALCQVLINGIIGMWESAQLHPKATFRCPIAAIGFPRTLNCGLELRTFLAGFHAPFFLGGVKLCWKAIPNERRHSKWAHRQTYALRCARRKIGRPRSCVGKAEAASRQEVDFVQDYLRI